MTEYDAVRNEVGLIDLSFRGKLQITGPDRVSFLQGMVTQDIKGIQEGSGAYALMTNPKGHILADMTVYNMGERLLLDIDPDLKDKVAEILDKYLFVNATITDVTDQYGLLSLQGPRSDALLWTILSEPVLLPEEHKHVRVKRAGVEISVIRVGYTGETGFELLAPHDSIKTLWDALMQQTVVPVRPVGLSTLDTLRVEIGIPKYGVDMDENNLPAEVGIEEKAISYTKGCYIGQEVIARMKYRGQANRLLMGLRFQGEGVPAREDKILKDDKDIGWITSAIFSPGFKCPLAMGYIHRDYAQPGTSVVVEMGQGALGGEVVSLPFYKR
jgi:glycine cleavage system T protein